MISYEQIRTENLVSSVFLQKWDDERFGNLPNGVTLTGITFHWKDISVSEDLYCWFVRYTLTNRELLVHIQSSGSGGMGYTSSSITYLILDNTQYSYYLAVVIPRVKETDVFSALTQVFIDYEYPA